MSGRYIGRYLVHDTPSRMSDAVGGMTHIASFHGEHMTAERDGGDLKVYSHHDEHGQPVQRFGNEEGTSGIKSNAGVGDARPNPRGGVVSHAENASAPRTIADLQKMHQRYFDKLAGRRRDAAAGDTEIHVHIA
jgi:hypothetical protein